MLVFNNEVFKQHSSRPGSSVDVSNIVRTFTKLGFDVQCHENQTKAQMMSTLKKGECVKGFLLSQVFFKFCHTL